jgi:hypothetical protein
MGGFNRDIGVGIAIALDGKIMQKLRQPRSFSAERDEPESILAIYAVSASSDPRSKGYFLARLSPRRGYQVPSSRPACGATKSQLRQPPRRGRKKCENWCSSGALFALFLLRFCMLALLCMLSR